MNDFKNITVAQLLDIILRLRPQAQAVLQGNEQSDEAMYYVLKERVGERLKEKYKTHEHVFFEEFEDVVDDFFLYLREGNGQLREPYHDKILGRWLVESDASREEKLQLMDNLAHSDNLAWRLRGKNYGFACKKLCFRKQRHWFCRQKQSFRGVFRCFCILRQEKTQKSGRSGIWEALSLVNRGLPRCTTFSESGTKVV